MNKEMSSHLAKNERLLDSPGNHAMGDWKDGLQWPFVAFNIIAEMMGGGLADLPAFVEHANRPLGFMYIVLAGLLSLYTSFFPIGCTLQCTNCCGEMTHR
jgi:hypothetical protein